MTTLATARSGHLHGQAVDRAASPGSPARPLARSLALPLGVAAAIAAAGSLFFPGLLAGPQVAIGNLRGTALVVLVLGLPLLGVGVALTHRGSVRGLVLWLGAAAYLTYQGVMFCFATPINALFLPYVALLGLGMWSLVSLVPAAATSWAAQQVGPRTPYRSAAAVLAVFAVLNGLAWLARVGPVTWTGDRPEALEGSGLLTSPVWVQDLAFWIPAAIAVSVLSWRRLARGAVLAAGLLVFYVLECLSVASDQWWGVRADADHPAVASMVAVPGGIAAAVVMAVPLVLLMPHLGANLRDRHEPR